MPNIEEKTVDFRTWVGVMGTMLGAFMAVLDIQITNSSLRDITGGIAATQDEGSWVSTSYLIGEIITIPLTAWLSRVFSVRWYLIVNVGLFLIFSSLCGTARSLGEMIAFRACQGFTGGVMIPMSLTVALSTLPKSKQPLGLALFGITATLGPALGPTVGGWLTDNYGWQWVFYINLIPGALMIGSIVFAVSSAPMQLYQLREGDWLGIGCMAIGLGSLIAMLEEGQRDDWLGSLFIERCALLAAIFIPAFVIIELSRKKPFVNLRLLAQRNLGIASAANFFLGSALYGTVYLLPQYLTIVQGYDAFQTGQAMIWVGLPQLLIFPFVPRLMKRFDLRGLVCFGTLIFAASCWMNTSMSHDYAGDQFVVSNIVRALGQPFTIVPLSALATSILQPKDAGDGSAVFNIARNLGGSVGTAMLDTIVTRREQFHDFEIGAYINAYRPVVQERVQTLATTFVNKGLLPENASSLARASHAVLEPRDKRCFWRRPNEGCLFPSSMAILQARATLRDIGRKTGFHYSTVSLALRDHQRIPDSTKQIIREAAKGLGYQPDAMLSALCAYRLTKRLPKGQTVIAWITNHRTRTDWRISACTRDYFEGASQRATERGYRLETFWLSEPGMTGERMSRILWTRGIQGVLLPPQEHLTRIDLAWDNLSAVTFGYTLVHPRLHLVSNHEYRTMGTLFSELEKRYYRRVGLVNLREHDKRVDNNWLAAYLVEQTRLQPEHQLPPLVLEQWNAKTFLLWVERYRPDAIVTRLPEVINCQLQRGHDQHGGGRAWSLVST